MANASAGPQRLTPNRGDSEQDQFNRTVNSSGWLHLCNGLDPMRDGGMVPSILGMTGGLARLRKGVTIVTPTESRLDDMMIPVGLTLNGPEIDLEASVRGSELVHLHGLWQSHTRRGARARAKPESLT